MFNAVMFNKCFLFGMNKYPNIFRSQNTFRVNIRIYLYKKIFIQQISEYIHIIKYSSNKYPNIFGSQNIQYKYPFTFALQLIPSGN